MNWLIVGLGNPGAKYLSTRHNVGFRVADSVAAKLSSSPGANPNGWSTKSECEFIKLSVGLDTCWIIKPLAFMNLSGQALQAFLHFFKLQPTKDNLIVVYDDLDFDPGVVRLRDSGSAGGHNGVSDIINVLGTDEFIRVRVGIGHPRRTEDRQSMPVENWVLSVAQGDDAKLLGEGEVAAADLTVKIIEEGFLKAKSGV